MGKEELIIANGWNAHTIRPEYKGQSFEGHPSMTIPDQTMSLRELLTRYALEQPIGGALEAAENEGVDFAGVKPETLDFTEIQRMRLETAARVREMEEKAKIEHFDTVAKRMAQKALEKERTALIDKQLEESKALKNPTTEGTNIS